MAFEWIVIHKDGGSTLETLISKKMPSHKDLEAFAIFFFWKVAIRGVSEGMG